MAAANAPMHVTAMLTIRAMIMDVLMSKIESSMRTLITVHSATPTTVTRAPTRASRDMVEDFLQAASPRGQ